MTSEFNRQVLRVKAYYLFYLVRVKKKNATESIRNNYLYNGYTFNLIYWLRFKVCLFKLLYFIPGSINSTNCTTTSGPLSRATAEPICASATNYLLPNTWGYSWGLLLPKQRFLPTLCHCTGSTWVLWTANNCGPPTTWTGFT